MIIVVTSLRLRKLHGFFKLSWNGFKITLQARKQPGFVRMKNTGFGYTHFTMSAWQTEEDAKAFAHSGPHLEAMKKSGQIATEIRVYKYPANQLPGWAEAKSLVLEKGRVFSF